VTDPAILTKRARQELARAIKWIAKDNPGTADGLNDAVLHAAQLIGRTPLVGPTGYISPAGGIRPMTWARTEARRSLPRNVAQTPDQAYDPPMGHGPTLLELSQSEDWQQTLARLAALPKAVAPAWPVIHLDEILARPTRLTDRITPDAVAKLLAYKQAVEAALPGMIETLILFGSRARGDAHAGSDYDVAIILRGKLGDDRGIRRRLSDVAFDQLTGDDLDMQTIELGADEFRPARRELTMRIAMDGVPIR
jgi:predicted nucleotidyltransferase/plasmid stabilization system protein ParE